MPRQLNPVPAIPDSISRKKRKLRPVSYSKKLRSKIPRRKRIPLFPIFDGSSNQPCKTNETDFSAFDAPSCSSTCFPGEVSYESSLVSVGSENPNKRQRSKENKAIGSSRVEIRADAKGSSRSDRRITRSYYKQNKNVRLDPAIEELFSQADDRDFSSSDAYSQRNLDGRVARSAKGASGAEENERKASSAATFSETSCIEPVFQENPEPKARSSKRKEISLQIQGNSLSAAPLSELSCIEPYPRDTSEPNASFYEGDGNSLQIQRNAASSIGFSEMSCHESLSPRNTLNLNQDHAEMVNLACSEQLSNGDDDSGYSTSCQEMTLSEIEEEIFPKNSEGDYIDFSQQSISSVFGESTDDSSEESDRSSSPSECFSLFLHYQKQFSCSPTALKFKSSHGDDEYYSDEFTLLRFEDEEDEESYSRFRTRERKQAFLHDYAEEYSLTTENGSLMVQQRLLMVNWAVEHYQAHELQQETLFLSVSLLDRFLSRGFFSSKKNLQLLGIACCTLATRIEENQPLNCVRQKTFQVGSNVYRSCEVVAMEWLVQEVLNYQCFMPTIYNFLWFYLKAAKADAETEDLTKYLAILSLLDHHSLCFWPSTVAAGLVILASLASNRDSSCQRVMETHVRTKHDDLPECIQSLEWLVKYAC